MNSELLDQRPPAATESEVALLAGLTEARKIDSDIVLRPDQFYDPRNAAIYREMIDLEADFGSWDDAALIDRLTKHPRFGQDGFDAGYIAEVVSASGLPSMVGYHAGKIIDAWQRRTVGNLALDIFQQSRNGGFNGEELVRSLDRIKAVVGGDDAGPGVGKVVSRTFDSIQTQKIKWLWPDRVPLGKYTELIGHPGVGKSVLTCDLMARVSRGTSCPDCDDPMGPGGVVLLTAEDDPGDTIKPRLEAAGADCSRIRLLEAVGTIEENGRRAIRSLSLDRDVLAVEEAVKGTLDCRLIVVDPISAYCGKIDSHKNAEVRALLMPIVELAVKHNVAVLGVTHFSKRGDGPATSRGMGSQAWVAAARMAWGVARDPDDPTVRLLLPIKCNLSADVSGLSYKIVDQDGVPVVAWSRDAVTKSVDDVLGASQGRRLAPKRRDVKEWLRGKLAGGEPVPANDILNDDDGAEFGERLIRWAKKELGVASHAEGFGRDAVWFWTLTEGGEE